MQVIDEIQNLQFFETICELDPLHEKVYFINVVWQGLTYQLLNFYKEKNDCRLYKQVEIDGLYIKTLM